MNTRLRWWQWLLLAVLVLVLAAGVAATWLLKTSSGARFALERAVQAMGEDLKLEGVEGDLAGPLRIAKVEYAKPDLLVRIEGLEVDTAPWSAIERVIDVRRLAARRVEVRTKPSNEPAKLPESIAIPHALRLRDGEVGELRHGTLGAANPDDDVVVRDIRLAGAGGPGGWTVDSASASMAQVQARLSGRIDGRKPYALEAKAVAQGRADERDWKANVGARGTLEALDLDLDGAFSGQPAKGRARVAPFSSFPLREVELRASGVDLAALVGGSITKLDLDVKLEGDPKAHRFAGPVRIRNEAAGPWDQRRIPVTSAQGRVVVTPDRVDVADLDLALAGGGGARGRGAISKTGVEADLLVADVNLAALHGPLQPTKLSGRIAAAGDRSAQRFQVALTDPRFAIEGRANFANDRLDVETARVRTGGGAVTATGTLSMAGAREFRFEGRAEHFDPSAFVKGPKGDLNFAFTTAGRLEGGPAGEAKATIAPSTYAGLPASGRVELAGDAKRVARADVDVAYGDAKVTARGAFGREGDALDFTFRAPDLAKVARPFDVALAGSAEGEGRLTGTFRAPAGRVSMKAANLALPGDVSVREASLRGEAGVAPESPIDVALDVKDLVIRREASSTHFADSIAARLKGTRAQHRLEVTTAMTKESTARLALAGGLEATAKAPAWSGRIESLAMQGPGAFALQKPASLVASAQRVEVGEAVLKGDWGQALFATTRWTPTTLELKGSSPGIEVRNVARAFKAASYVPRSTLVVAADWDVRSGETLDGRVGLRRVSGDLRMGEPALELGLSELDFAMEVARGRLQMKANVVGTRAGTLRGEGTGLIVRGEKGWELSSQSPLAGRILAEHTNLEALAAWLGPDARLGGRLNADLKISGVGRQPLVEGDLKLAAFTLREPQSGFEMEQGELAVNVTGRRVTLERFRAVTPWRPVAAAREAFANFEIPATGTITADGTIDLARREGTVRLKADRAVVTQHTTRFVAVSGEATLKAGADGMLASGKFTGDAAWVGALDNPLPTVAEDVVVVRKAAAVAPEEAKAQSTNPLRLDLVVGLGRHTYFEGRGLDTRLAGEIAITGQVGGEIKANGTIRTVGGTYKGYGQNLAIDRGVLTFAGPIDNPRLNVLAVRRGLAVEPGVEVLGTATRPRVRLVSTPDVPEPEKLSWLVLGRGPSELGPGDASVLLQAASSMLGRNAPGTDLGKRLGLDEVKIGRADTNSILGVLPQSTVAGKTGSPAAADVVTVGKRIGRDLTLTYEQGLADAEGALKVAWRLSRQFQILVRAGYLPGVDAVYRWSIR